MSEVIRLARYEELKEIVKLYKQLQPNDSDVSDNSELKEIWDSIYKDPNLYYIVVEVDGKIVSSCNIAIIKNLTRNLRPYGLIENVVTDLNYRKRGYATKALNFALDIARKNSCYKVMLLTGSKNEETLRFYETVGFERGVKTGFVISF